MFSGNDAAVANAANPEPPKVNFNTTPSFNFGAPTNAATVFGNPTASGGFNFANNNNNNNNNAGKTDSTTTGGNLFAPPAAGANLFNIGGGGPPNGAPGNNVSASGRKIKRAHRKLGGTRR
jgi:hypothetical protein